MKTTKALIYVGSGAALLSLASVLAKVVTIHPTMSGFYRCLIGAVVLFFMGGGILPTKIPWAPRKYLTIAGTGLSLDLFFWHKSILIVGAGIGTILVNTQVFFVTIMSIAVYGLSPSRRFWLATVLAFLGLGLLVNPEQSGNGASGQWMGTLLGLTAAVFYSIYILFLQRAEKEKTNLPMVQRFFYLSLVMTVALGILATVEGSWQWPTANQWPPLLALGILVQVAAWMLVAKGITHLPINIAALILLIQPMFSTLLGVLFLGEILTKVQWVGAAAALAGVYVGSREKVSSPAKIHED